MKRGTIGDGKISEATTQMCQIDMASCSSLRAFPKVTTAFKNPGEEQEAFQASRGNKMQIKKKKRNTDMIK